MKKIIETIKLCDSCYCAICSHGEKIIKLESLYYNENFDDVDTVKCEWCDDELEKDQIFECVFM